MDLFRDTHRSEMPLTSDYVFRAAFGRDRDDSRAALMAILNIILDRKGALNWLMRIEKVKIK
ncbi:MAG: hypothetical protein SOW80_03550 [Anaerovoracaceae bacterium]|nr:hypothetical protein [Anaerovoracaceae bacterium]